MLTSLNRKIAAGALTIAATTGAAITAPAIAPHDNVLTAPSASAATANKFHYISQLQGQPNQNIDCGPTSILMALLQNGGRVPLSYNRDNQAQALMEIRGNIRGYLSTVHVEIIMAQRGVPGTAFFNANAPKAINEIKAGKKAIILTQTGVIAGEQSAPGYGHYVYISGYDKRTGTFTVNDPLKIERASYQATEEQLYNIITHPAPGNSQWVYTI